MSGYDDRVAKARLEVALATCLDPDSHPDDVRAARRDLGAEHDIAASLAGISPGALLELRRGLDIIRGAFTRTHLNDATEMAVLRNVPATALSECESE